MAHTHIHVPDFTRSTIQQAGAFVGPDRSFLSFLKSSQVSYANSLALLTDAAHNATDVIALALTWWALRFTTRPANSGKTYGYHRAGILVALVNSTTLVLIALGIFYDAYRRLMAPPEVKANVLIGVGLAAVVSQPGDRSAGQAGQPSRS